MEWPVFVQWGFEGLLAILVMAGINILGKIRDSVEFLNAQMATVMEKNQWHEKEIDRLSEKVEALESRGKKKKNCD